ncbi:MAG: sucrase ferredoxin, partial [Williamsia herbipolensis]|nr:sucrase ferredoxin [Williamsia herbipolensis]
LDRVVQAAQHAARTRLGDDRIEAYPPIATAATDDGWRVELAAGSATVVVDVAEGTTSPLFTTCEATRAVPIRQYAATGLEVRRG